MPIIVNWGICQNTDKLLICGITSQLQIVVEGIIVIRKEKGVIRKIPLFLGVINMKQGEDLPNATQSKLIGII